MHFVRTLVVCVCGVVAPGFVPVAAAQVSALPPETAGRTTATWNAAAGYESFWLRSVARTARPMDASEVRWSGGGPTLLFSCEWLRPTGTRRLELLVSSLGGFGYQSPIGSISRPGESSSWLAARYEQRRLLFRQHLPRTLDIGAGFQALGERTAFSRRFEPDIAQHSVDLVAGFAFVMSVRWHAWRRVEAEAAWANGALGGHSSWTRDRQAASSGWGGGWLTDLMILGAVPVANRTSVALRYGRAEHFLSRSLSAYITSRRQLTIGVTYGK